MFKSTYN